MAIPVEIGEAYIDGYGRTIHIVSKNPWDDGLFLGVYILDSKIQPAVFLPDGRRFGRPNGQGDLISLEGVVKCQ